MGQEDKTRFSHITVGRSDASGRPQQEDEEVITIGAVDVVSPPAPVSVSEVLVGESEPSSTHAADPEERPVQASDESGLDAPMPTAQKLVIAACLVGLVVAIAFLVWFWTTQRGL
jgi:hypothetical protein